MQITAYCQVVPGKVLLNGTTVFEHEGPHTVDFLKSAYRGLKIKYPKFFKMDSLCKLAFLTAETMLSDGRVKSGYEPKDIGIFIQNSSSSLSTDEKHQESIASREEYFPSPSVFVYTLANIMAGELAIRHGFKGENAVQVVEKPDPELLSQTVREAFENQRIECCVAGWVEEYRNNLTSCLFIVENSIPINSSTISRESIIFDPANMDRLFKDVL